MPKIAPRKGIDLESGGPNTPGGGGGSGGVVGLMQRIRDAKWFQNGITIVIVLAGVLVGIETYREFAKQHHFVMHLLDQIIIWIFVAEVVVKMWAEWPRPWRYFFDPWNVFDFLIVAACFMPVDAQYVMVLRLARLLRVLKLVRALPKLQVLVGALLRSIPSMAYVSLLLLLLFYVYAVAATFMFSKNDPVHFATLPLSMLSLFRAVTLEDWTDLMYINQKGCDQYGYESVPHLCTAPEAFPYGSPFVFVSLVLLGTMIILNLFIGVIMNGMDSAREENELAERERRRIARGEEVAPLYVDLDSLVREMDRLQNRLTRVKVRAEKEAGE
ncbi:MAG: ion transporter [Polyangia bacterium]